MHFISWSGSYRTRVDSAATIVDNRRYRSKRGPETLIKQQNIPARTADLHMGSTWSNEVIMARFFLLLYQNRTILRHCLVSITESPPMVSDRDGPKYKRQSHSSSHVLPTLHVHSATPARPSHRPTSTTTRTEGAHVKLRWRQPLILSAVASRSQCQSAFSARHSRCMHGVPSSCRVTSFLSPTCQSPRQTHRDRSVSRI
jgi:hypothetical protein